MQLITYFSKKLLDAETRYAPHEVELLAIIASFKKFRPYIECRPTVVKMDHRPLIHVKTQPHLSNKKARWAQKLGRYHYTVEYKTGVTNIITNALSRRPNHQVKNAKFVHFCDQQGLPLLSACVFEQQDIVATKFERFVLPARGFLKRSTSSTISTLVDVPVAYIGFKDGDRNFLQQYVARVALHLQFAQVVASA